MSYYTRAAPFLHENSYCLIHDRKEEKKPPLFSTIRYDQQEGGWRDGKKILGSGDFLYLDFFVRQEPKGRGKGAGGGRKSGKEERHHERKGKEEKERFLFAR